MHVSYWHRYIYIKKFSKQPPGPSEHRELKGKENPFWALKNHIPELKVQLSKSDVHGSVLMKGKARSIMALRPKVLNIK